jgi:hypothetical protein
MSYELLTTQTPDPTYPAPVDTLELKTVNLLSLSACRYDLVKVIMISTGVLGKVLIELQDNTLINSASPANSIEWMRR